MPRTFEEKLESQIMNKWLVLDEGDIITYFYIEAQVYYQQSRPWADEGWIPYIGSTPSEAKLAYLGYYIKDIKGEPFTCNNLESFYNPFHDDNKDKRKLTLETLLRCYKLTDSNKKNQLNKLLAKRLLNG